MNIIETFLLEKEEKKIITKEIVRNESISDEVISLSIDIENFREILCENLMFDYISLAEEAKNLNNICRELNIDFSEVHLTFITSVESILKQEEKMCDGLRLTYQELLSIRVNKRLILSNMEANYPSLFAAIKERANHTIDLILKGLVV